jgi:replicative DNA helicase
MTETRTYNTGITLPPQNQDAEDAVIGSILINPSTYEEIAGTLVKDDFYILRNGQIWNTFEVLHQHRSQIDILTVSEELSREGILDEVGGVAYLSALVNNIPTTLHVEAYAKIVRDKSHRRKLLEDANRLARLAYDEKQDIITGTQDVIDRLVDNSTRKGGAVHISAFTGQLVQEVDIRRDNPTAIWGIQTGFYDFDAATGGLQDGELMIIAGDSGIGKSMLVGQLAVQMAAAGFPGGYYSLEMTGVAVARRMVSGMSKINTRKLKTGMLSEPEYRQFTEYIGRMSGLPLFMSDVADWNLLQLRSDLARLKREYGIRWFVLDYLYLMDAGTSDEIAASTIISKGLKLICRELKISGIAVASVNKLGMDNNKPTKSMLRGSGQSVFNSDILCMMTKDEINPNIRRITFTKGRELEIDMHFFDLIKKDAFPYFHNVVNKRIELEQL